MPKFLTREELYRLFQRELPRDVYPDGAPSAFFSNASLDSKAQVIALEYEAASATYQNIFPASATPEFIPDWETTVFGSPRDAGDPLQDRRDAVVGRLRLRRRLRKIDMEDLVRAVLGPTTQVEAWETACGEAGWKLNESQLDISTYLVSASPNQILPGIDLGNINCDLGAAYFMVDACFYASYLNFIEADWATQDERVYSLHGGPFVADGYLDLSGPVAKFVGYHVYGNTDLTNLRGAARFKYESSLAYKFPLENRRLLTLHSNGPNAFHVSIPQGAGIYVLLRNAGTTLVDRTFGSYWTNLPETEFEINWDLEAGFLNVLQGGVLLDTQTFAPQTERVLHDKLSLGPDDVLSVGDDLDKLRAEGRFRKLLIFDKPQHTANYVVDSEPIPTISPKRIESLRETAFTFYIRIYNQTLTPEERAELDEELRKGRPARSQHFIIDGLTDADKIDGDT